MRDSKAIEQKPLVVTKGKTQENHKEFFEFIGPIHKPRRKSFLIALELFAILAFCVIFWQAGFGTLGEATEIFLGLYFAEFCSGAINKNPLSKNIFIELPIFVYSICCPRKHSNAKKNAETKPLNEKNVKEAPTSTYGTIPRPISQTSTLSNGTNSSLQENQLSLSVMPTIPSSSTEFLSHTIDISSAVIDERSQVSGDNNLINATFSS